MLAERYPIMFDFHTHTIFSDGELIPSELVRRAAILGCKGIALTDHVDFSNIDHVLAAVKRAKILEEDIGIKVIIGVEITHVPPKKIDKLVSKAKKGGSELIVVHGETISEPVALGTNEYALKNEDVDILAHPGLISEKEASLAAKNDIYLELTTRGGHNLTNGHVARVARISGAKLLINTDTHSPGDLIDEKFALKAAMGAGLTEKEAKSVVYEIPKELISKIH